MPYHGDAEILQVLSGQPWQHLGIDSIIEERRGVLLKPQFPQPIGDLDRHGRGHALVKQEQMDGYST